MDWELDDAEAKLFAEIGHFDRKDVAVAADGFQPDFLKGVTLPEFEAGGHVAHADSQDGAAV